MINLFDFLRTNEGKNFTAQELRQNGFNVSRTELRTYVRKGVLAKAEKFLNNTIKKDLSGAEQKGTRVYTYSLA